MTHDAASTHAQEQASRFMSARDLPSLPYKASNVLYVRPVPMRPTISHAMVTLTLPGGAEPVQSAIPWTNISQIPGQSQFMAMHDDGSLIASNRGAVVLRVCHTRTTARLISRAYERALREGSLEFVECRSLSAEHTRLWYYVGVAALILCSTWLMLSAARLLSTNSFFASPIAWTLVVVLAGVAWFIRKLAFSGVLRAPHQIPIRLHVTAIELTATMSDNTERRWDWMQLERIENSPNGPVLKFDDGGSLLISAFNRTRLAALVHLRLTDPDRAENERRARKTREDAWKRMIAVALISVAIALAIVWFANRNSSSVSAKGAFLVVGTILAFASVAAIDASTRERRRLRRFMKWLQRTRI